MPWRCYNSKQTKADLTQLHHAKSFCLDFDWRNDATHTTLSGDSLLSYTAQTGRAQISVSLIYRKVAVGRDSSVGIATRYGSDIILVCLRVSRWWTETCFYVIRCGDRIPVEGRYSTPVQTAPGAHPASCTVHTGSVCRGKAAGAWRWPPNPQSSAEVEERVELYIYSGLSWQVLRWILTKGWLKKHRRIREIIDAFHPTKSKPNFRLSMHVHRPARVKESGKIARAFKQPRLPCRPQCAHIYRLSYPPRQY